MPDTDFESAVAAFLALGRRLQNQPDRTANHIVEECARWYRDVRIDEASVHDGNDVLLVEWGALRPMDISEPTDFRPPGSYGGIKWVDTLYKAIQLTRQVVPAAGHEEPQFDELAVDLSIMLCFEPATEDEQGDSTSIDRPDDVDRDLVLLRLEPFVEPLLAVPAWRIVVTVDCAG